MGAEPYFYYVKYQPDIDQALQHLREREFLAGRYNPAMPFISFPITSSSPAPGAQHGSIEEAMEASDADGTRSILDLQFVGNDPGFFTASRLSDERLVDLYGTAKPTREMVHCNMGFFEDIDRGQGVYIVIYKDGMPDELLFAGYSFD